MPCNDEEREQHLAAIEVLEKALRHHRECIAQLDDRGELLGFC